MSDSYEETLEALANKINKISDKISLTPVLDKLLNIDDNILKLKSDTTINADTALQNFDSIQMVLDETKFKMGEIIKKLLFS